MVNTPATPKKAARVSQPRPVAMTVPNAQARAARSAARQPGAVMRSSSNSKRRISAATSSRGLEQALETTTGRSPPRCAALAFAAIHVRLPSQKGRALIVSVTSSWARSQDGVVKWPSRRGPHALDCLAGHVGPHGVGHGVARQARRRVPRPAQVVRHVVDEVGVGRARRRCRTALRARRRGSIVPPLATFAAPSRGHAGTHASRLRMRSSERIGVDRRRAVGMLTTHPPSRARRPGRCTRRRCR